MADLNYYGKPWDSPTTRMNRRLAQPLIDLLLKTPITPNQVTYLSIVACLLACGLVISGENLPIAIGGVLFWLADILDVCDGAIARQKKMESEWGKWLDNVVANRPMLFCFVASVFVALIRRGEMDIPMGWGIEMIVVLAAALFLDQWALLLYGKGAPEEIRERHHSYVAYLKRRPDAPLIDRLFFRHLVLLVQRSFYAWLFMFLAIFQRLAWLIDLVFVAAHLVGFFALFNWVRLRRQLARGRW